MPKQREKMTEVHSCGSPPFSTCLGAVASFIISQGQKCHKKPFPLVYHQSHKEKSVKGGHRPQRLPLILFFVGYNAGGENGCPSVPLLPPVLHCPFRRKKVKGLFFICSMSFGLPISEYSRCHCYISVQYCHDASGRRTGCRCQHDFTVRTVPVQCLLSWIFHRHRTDRRFPVRRRQQKRTEKYPSYCFPLCGYFLSSSDNRCRYIIHTNCFRLYT